MPDPPIVITPPDPADSCVIWLHGLGADGHDFEGIHPELGEAATRRTKFVFPHAPFRPVTINGGYKMRAWYDIVDTDLSRRADETGVRESSILLEEWIQDEVDQGIPMERIVLAGFSQGGAIVLHTGIRSKAALGGIMALSTYLPVPDKVDAEVNRDNAAETPIFMAHGLYDDVIAHDHAVKSKEKLEELGFDVAWESYPMPHSVCAEEIGEISDWLVKVLDLS
ncbi:MAG: dienelactone hydrolase family protein [Verrucomicrobiota bacterium]